MVSERRWLWSIFVFYFLLGIGYSLLMPIWEAPDEPAHYHLAWRLARKGEYATEELNYEANQPQAFYYIGSFVIRALDSIDPKYSDYIFPREYKYNIRVPERRFDWNDSNYRFLLGVYALRWLNLLFGALALWINWKTFKVIAPEKPALQLSALAFAALTPQYLHIMSSVNNDALGTLASAILFYLAVCVVKEENNFLAILSIILAVVLPLVSKLTVLPVSAALLAIIIGKWFLGLRQKRWLILAGLILVLSLSILYVLFPEAIQWAQEEIAWRLIFGLRKNALTAEYITKISSQIVWTYWGKVGWIAVGLSWWVVDLLTALGLFGVTVQIHKLIQLKKNHPQFDFWMATTITALFTVLAVARNGLTTGATQGRFLFPAIGALSLLMVAGWYDRFPGKIQQRLPLIVLVLMFVLNTWLWVFEIIPVYYQPFLD